MKNFQMIKITTSTKLSLALLTKQGVTNSEHIIPVLMSSLQAAEKFSVLMFGKMGLKMESKTLT